jgi:4-hydroxybenzoate polyprenyltransferase
VRPYLQLLRPANVVTALADVLAGFAVAGLQNLSALPWLLCSTSCLYAGGVVLNDVFDRAVDARERPERPIPSGRVPVATAAWLGGGLLVGGVGFAALANVSAALVAAAIAAAVLVYDSWGKHQTVIGPVNMGTCRGLNLILGMAATPEVISASWSLAALPLTYIAGVTIISRGEVFGTRKETAGVSLGLVLAVITAVLVLSRQGPAPSLAAGIFGLALFWRVVPPFWTAFRQPEPAIIRHAVKRGVLSLVLLDAALAASYANTLFALVVLATGLLAALLARSFAVT